jgi:hypothetical protein
MVDLEVQSLRRVLTFVIEPLLRSAPIDVQQQMLRTLGALAGQAKTGPENAKRYQFEAVLHEYWSRVAP